MCESTSASVRSSIRSLGRSEIRSTPSRQPIPLPPAVAASVRGRVHALTVPDVDDDDDDDDDV